MTRNKKWQKLEDYVASNLKKIDKYAKPTKGSRDGDVQTSINLHIECKQRNTRSVQINNEVWKKICREIPLHSLNIPMLVLENKDKKRWACLDLDDFLESYIELIELRREDI